MYILHDILEFILLYFVIMPIMFFPFTLFVVIIGIPVLKGVIRGKGLNATIEEILLPNQVFSSNIYNTGKATSKLRKDSTEPEPSMSESIDDDVEMTFPHRNGFDFPTASSSSTYQPSDFTTNPGYNNVPGNISYHR